MTVKEKILDALNCTIDDINEDRLIDILIDAYETKVREVEKLESANEVERHILHRKQAHLDEEHRRMRLDPLYCTAGEYYFRLNKQMFSLYVHGFKLQLFMKTKDNCILAERISSDAWMKEI